MHDLAAAKKHRDLAPIPVIEEAADVLELGLIIVLVGFGPDLDFLYLNRSLFFAGFLQFFLLLVFKPTEIHE